jgi:nucleotide-binding universal stress UspA family protein
MVVRPERILWPTDFSLLSLHGARYARGFRDAFGGMSGGTGILPVPPTGETPVPPMPVLHVIHVIPPPLMPDLAGTLPPDVPVTFSDPEFVAACRSRLATLVVEQFDGPAGVVTDVLFGNPWSVICQYAKDAQIDLLVVSTHGRTGLRHVLIGSTAERIVQHAPCPVLVVKNPEKDFVVP